MKRYKCTVSYAGAHYGGWQTQKNNTSVQAVIEEVLFSITREKITITAAGRTDAGVNAKGQVFHFDTEREMTPYKWMGALNGLLPPDIHIESIEETDMHFHARYCVLSKQYDYRINLGSYDVLTREYVWQCPYTLDVEKMQEASKYFLGTHDFTAFNATPLSEKPDQVRTIESIEFKREGDILTISYTGRGFLRYMVRMMTAQLIEAGRGKIAPEEIQKLLDTRSKTTVMKNARPEGLTLMKVNYFRVLAENEDLMIREFIGEEEKPGLPEVYAVSLRHEEKIVGYVQITGQEKKAHLYDETYADKLTELLQEF